MKKVYRLSRFVTTSRTMGSRFVLYNVRNGKYKVLHTSDEPFCRLLSTNGAITERDTATSVLRTLLRNGFIVPQDFDEYTEHKRQRRLALERDYGLRLAVMPTLNCNLACVYCFQDKAQSPAPMSATTRQNLLRFADEKLTKTKGPLSVTWFGGEPLLELNLIRELTSEFRRLAKAHNNEAYFTLITNGYRLEKLTRQMIRELAISSIQVSLDGPADIHDNMRPCKSGKGSFGRIIENIQGLNTHYDSILIRINVGKLNYRHIPPLLLDLQQRGILDRQKYALSYIYENTGKYTTGRESKNARCSANACISFEPSEWADTKRWITKKARRLGVASDYENLDHTKPLVECSSQVSNAFVVDPIGNVYKCLNDASIPERALHNLNSGNPVNPSREAQLKNATPFECRICQECMYLPLCNGGCPSARTDGTETHICNYLRYYIPQQLDDVLRKHIEEKRNARTQQ